MTINDEKKGRSGTYNVCFFGCSLGTGNRGVSALTASLVKIFLEMYPNARFSLLIACTTSTPQKLKISDKNIELHVINYRLALKTKIREHLFFIFFLACLFRVIPFRSLKNRVIQTNRWLQTVMAADFIGDIRGGDSFSDIYGMRRFLLGSIPRIIPLILKKPFILLPQTYGPYNKALSRYIARYIFKKSKFIMSRDKESITTIKELLDRNVDMRKIQFCPDVAFVLDSIVPDEICIEPPLVADTNNSVVGININGLMFNGGYTRRNMFGLRLDYRNFVFRLIDMFLKDPLVHILLIPHAFGPQGNINSDPDACTYVMYHIQSVFMSRLHMVNKEYNQHEIKGLIGACNFFIGSRMHACIAALSQGIPTVGVAYSKKFIGVFNSTGFGDMVIDARKEDDKSALDKIARLYSSNSWMREKLAGEVSMLKNKIFTSFKELTLKISQ